MGEKQTGCLGEEQPLLIIFLKQEFLLWPCFVKRNYRCGRECRCGYVYTCNVVNVHRSVVIKQYEWECNMGPKMWKWYVNSSKHEHEIIRWADNCTAGEIFWNVWAGTWQVVWTLMFIVVQCARAKMWKQLKYPSVSEWISKCDICIQWSIIQPSKGKKNDTCYNREKPWGCYAKWNKPDTKGQILSNCTYIKYID